MLIKSLLVHERLRYQKGSRESRLKPKQQVGAYHLYFVIFAPIKLLDLLPCVSCFSMENC
jgi:hypothetical protein